MQIMLVKQLVWPLDESQGPSQPHGQGPWLMCEVTFIHVGDNTDVKLIFFSLLLVALKSSMAIVNIHHYDSTILARDTCVWPPSITLQTL
jgi:hypothetical protein